MLLIGYLRCAAGRETRKDADCQIEVGQKVPIESAQKAGRGADFLCVGGPLAHNALAVHQVIFERHHGEA